MFGLKCESARPREPAPPGGPGGGEGGFILVPVLLALSILGLIAITLTKTVSLDLAVSVNNRNYAEAEVLADGLARLTTQYLVVNGAGASSAGQFRLDGTPIACRAGGDIAILAILDTAGLIDINLASKETLERLFIGIGLSEDDAARLAAEVIDFRDLDDIRLIDGSSEMAAYQEAGLGHGPKNAPFATVGELDQVLGMTPAILARIRPLVTVYSRMKGIDTAVASPEVLALPLPSVPVQRPATRSYVIRVAVFHGPRTRFTRETVIELSSRAPGGYLLKEWNRVDDAATYQLPESDSLATCLSDVLKIE